MQNLAKTILFSGLLAFAAATQVGAVGVSRATLAQPASAPKQVIIDGKLWKCTGVDCSASAAGSDQPLGRECARAVKVLGKVTAFSRDGKALDAPGLAACNTEA